jgi:TrmH family RNA methyltransferase
VFVAEGAKLIEVALRCGRVVESVFVAAGGRDHSAVAELLTELEAAGARTFDLAPGVMERVADTVTPQPICAIVAAVDIPLATLFEQPAAAGGDRLFLLCVDVRDPGNLGSVLRIGAASGVAGVVVCAGSVDPYNAKTVRASAGAVFHVPLVKAPDAATTLAFLRECGVRLLGTTASGGTDYLEVAFDGDVALVLGNEAAGLPAELEASLDGAVTIPMAAGTESLNVAMTAAVLCFEAARRRRAGEIAPSGGGA